MNRSYNYLQVWAIALHGIYEPIFCIQVCYAKFSLQYISYNNTESTESFSTFMDYYLLRLEEPLNLSPSAGCEYYPAETHQNSMVASTKSYTKLDIIPAHRPGLSYVLVA